MSLGVLNNISAVNAENNLNLTQNSLNKTLQQLSSGSRINSGADDAAGLSLANALTASSAALSQSAANATEGVDFLQVADGAFAQVTSLLNRAVTLATEAANGTLNSLQVSATQAEYSSILSEVNTIGSNTEFNGINVFNNAVNVFTADGTVTQTYSGTALGALTTTALGLSATTLTATTASSALIAITSAIATVASDRGTAGAAINTLTAVENVQSSESTNVLSSENDVIATDFGAATSNLSKFQILLQSGISALSQANTTQQLVTKLLQ